MINLLRISQRSSCRYFEVVLIVLLLLTVSNSGWTKTLQDTIPDDFPGIETQLYGIPAEGDIFLSPIVSSPYKLFILDDTGYPKSYLEDEPIARYLDFKKLDENLYTYHFDPPGFEPAYYLTDSSYHVIDSVRAGNGHILDSHDIIFMENGHALVLVYEQREVDMSQILTGGNPNAMVTGLLIQEVDFEQNVYWEWSSFDHFEITDGISQGGNNLIDFTLPVFSYVHANSLDLDEAGNILLCARNTHEVTKIEYPSGNILWRMGGHNNEFTFIDDPLQGFTDQHDARWTGPNRITVFDNGNFHDPPLSRVVEYELDQINKTATLIWEFQNPYGVQATAAGNAQRLSNGNTFIGWGIISPNDAPVITEVEPDGAIVFELSFKNEGMPASQFSYRAFRFINDVPIGLNKEIIATGITIYPNPVDIDHLFVKLPEAVSGAAEIELLDIYGKVMLRQKFIPNARPIALHIADLPPGIWLCRMLTGNSWKTEKFIRIKN